MRSAAHQRREETSSRYAPYGPLAHPVEQGTFESPDSESLEFLADPPVPPGRILTSQPDMEGGAYPGATKVPPHYSI